MRHLFLIISFFFSLTAKANNKEILVQEIIKASHAKELTEGVVEALVSQYSLLRGSFRRCWYAALQLAWRTNNRIKG